jgi:hypothetical protein
LIRLHAVFRDDHRLNQPAVVEAQLVDAHHTVIPVGLTERPAMIDDVPFAGRRRL